MVSTIKIPYHKRLFILLLAFSWTIIVCFAVFQYLREKQYKSDIVNTELQYYNRGLLKAIEDGLPYEEYIASQEQPFENLRISVITFSGAVIYDNMIPPVMLDNHRKRPEMADAMKKGSGYYLERQSASDGQQYFYSASKGKRVVVRTAIPYSESLRELLKADWGFLFVMLIVSVVMSTLAYFATRKLGKTIERLNRFADKARNGESFDESEPFPNDELGSISSHIVRLYTQWQQTIADRDMEHEAAMREEQEKIRIKHELTNNINHELKTPVASIQVCLETLLSNITIDEAKKQELIERCYVQSNRLRRLLNDVSLITRIEDGSQLILKKEVSINEIIKEIASDMEIMPESERMIFNMDFNKNVSLYGNPSLIGSIFRNLTENAIAYSGGRNIYVTLLEDDERQCRIRFEDDGHGVDEKHLSHLFERFYRIDKGRSRQMGGTGLGLSIVKHAVRFHGGYITVCNRTGGGLTFEFTLKK